MMDAARAEDDGRPLLVCFSLFAPYPGVPHAGGEYVLRHLSVLSRQFRVVLIAPGNVEENRTADVTGLPWTTIVVPGSGFFASSIAAPLRAAHRAIRGATYRLDVVRAIRRDPTISDLIHRAEVVEFQWLETASLARWVTSLAPRVRTVVIVHDVLTQRWTRAAKGATNVLRKVFFFARSLSAGRAQRRVLAAVDVAVVFSEKDERLLAAYARQSPEQIVTIHPPLEEASTDYARKPVDGGGKVLFTGAFSRPENDHAARWLIGEVWPLVRESVPDAQLTVAGAGPSEALRALVGGDPDIVLTDYVPSLDPYYASADVFVAPLHSGAGVKFKTATAMLWGLPVVATPIGAEGIGGVHEYVAVTADRDDFAAGIVTALTDSVTSGPASERGRAWARSAYGHEGFQTKVLSLYLGSPVD